MFKKVWLIVSVCALVFVFGATNVFAAGAEPTAGICQFYNADEDMTVPGYCDGRINAFDIDQPVAIYYTYDTVQVLDDDGSAYSTDAVSGIELWAIDADGTGQLAMWVPLANITPAFGATSNVQIASAQGIALNYSPSANAFWVTAPGYSFAWEAW
jgi:hypothetical protein